MLLQLSPSSYNGRRNLFAALRWTLLGIWMVCALSSAAPLAEPDGAAHLNEFQFIRLIYANNQCFRNRRSSWTTDAPAAETHLLDGIRRLTRVDATIEGKALSIMDERLFDYPFVYAVEVGHWYLNDAEAQRLREYLLRGGFLVVDDFHGTQEWQCFLDSMKRVFPDRPIVDLAEDDGVFHVVYDVDHRIQIPGLWGAINGQSWEKDGYIPYWRGIYDDENRLMVAINFNMDLGDAWEHADNPEYPVPMTTLAYHFAIDYLVYAMTH